MVTRKRRVRQAMCDLEPTGARDDALMDLVAQGSRAAALSRKIYAGTDLLDSHTEWRTATLASRGAGP